MIDRNIRIGSSALGLVACLLAPVASTAGPEAERYALLQQSDAAAEAAEKHRAAWRAARESLRDEQFVDAERRFHAIIKDQPDSRYVPESYYWRAYALYELGGQERLREAAQSLGTMMKTYPDHSSVEEAHDLLQRIRTQLMNEHADREAAEAILEDLEEWEKQLYERRDEDDEPECDELKLVAINSLMQMNERRALPVLRRVIEDHTKCAELREKAIFVAAQHESPQATQLILDAARNDPDTHVRQQAVFWLSQVDGEESLAALQEIAHDRTDPEVQLKAVFALSQHDSPGAAATLEQLARDPQTDREVREQAIFWLGQTDDSFAFLSGIYDTLEDPELREKVLFSISQTDTRAAGQWLRERALDPEESQELRKKALFWLMQMGEVSCEDVKKLYTEFADREMKEQLIFGLSQMDEPCATRTLVELARQEKDPELLEKMIFWLGQTGDDEALDFLEELINR